jgi:hypothetical protein
MSVPIAIPQFTPVNSTTYADIVGLEGNLDRLPRESSDLYLDRLARASVENRTHVYEGLVAEIAAQLGLSVQPGIRISGPANTSITCDLTGISLVSGSTSLTCPLVTLDADEAWSWNSLSSLVQTINSSNLWTATLLAPDGAAVQLCRQTNTGVGMPYECVTSQVGVIGMLEPSLSTIAATPSGGLAYQVREILQAIMKTDRSYWAR